MKYFSSLERYNASKKMLNRIKLDDGEIVTDQQCILEEMKKFYEKLYTETETNTNIDEYLMGLNIPRLTNEQKNQLDEPITIKEVRVAEAQLKKE